MSDELLRRLGEDLAKRREAIDRGEGPPELVRPLDDEERRSVLDGAFARLESDAGGEDETFEDGTPEDEPQQDEAPEDDVPEPVAPVDESHTDEPEAGKDETPEESTQRPETSEKVVPLSAGERSISDDRPGSSLLPILGTVLAIAAAVLIWLGARERAPQTEPERVAALPSYTFTRVVAGDATHRSADDSIPEHVELTPDGRIELELRPAEPVREPVGVAIVARPAAGPPIVTRPSNGVEISANGAVRVRATLRDLVELRPGEWTLSLLVGAPERLPDGPAGLEVGPAPWRTLELRVTVLPPG